MYALIMLLKLFLNIVYLFIKLFPTQNKITLISRQKNEPSLDFNLIEDKIKEELPDYELIILSKTIEPGIINSLMYFFHFFSQMYHIATSRIVILDSYCIVASILHHKKDLKIIQMWHALGAYKKFGYSILDMGEGTKSKIAKLMHMHRNYNCVFASSLKCIEPYSKAFNVDKEKIRIFPLPRVDLLTNKKYISRKQKEILHKYPQLKNKKTILYAPTFRKKCDIKIEPLLKAFNFKDYNLVVSLHPLMNFKVEYKNVIVASEFSTLELLLISDCLITDYSAIIYEAAILGKAIYFYMPDFNRYRMERDFYIDCTSELPGDLYKNPRELMAAIENNNYDAKRIKTFARKYINIKKEYSCVNDIVSFIVSLLPNDIREKLPEGQSKKYVQ